MYSSQKAILGCRAIIGDHKEPGDRRGSAIISGAGIERGFHQGLWGSLWRRLLISLPLGCSTYLNLAAGQHDLAYDQVDPVEPRTPGGILQEQLGLNEFGTPVGMGE